MSKCENCIHYDACEDWANIDNLNKLCFPFECEGDIKPCEFFKDKSLFVELPKEKPNKTNFDRITESVDSLVDYIYIATDDCPFNYCVNVDCHKGGCKDCIKEWLQKENEE